MSKISIVWFRQDLRISDNEAFFHGCGKGPVMPIYILDQCAPQGFEMGSATKVWLHASLQKLNESLQNKLNFYVGQASEIIEHLINLYSVEDIFWNLCYEPWHLEQEERVKQACNKKSTYFHCFNSNYLYYPNEILKNDESYYKVFTAYKKKALSLSSRPVCPVPEQIQCVKDASNSLPLEALNLLTYPAWWKEMVELWEIGEEVSKRKLVVFLNQGLKDYKKNRNYPGRTGVSRLSPHLHFGEISPSQIVRALHGMECVAMESGSLNSQNKKITDLEQKKHCIPEEDKEHFISEILWREFSCYLLYHFKKLPVDSFNDKFKNFPWEDNKIFFEAWTKGRTGYPLVDAGMRELWQTGYMHNRVRMVVASFLTKNLNIHWRQGMNWFWDCLLDADLANNSASWQWVAGSGADAAPYFRIFNPTLQGETFDGEGVYTKQFVPELKHMPPEYLFRPWLAPASVLKQAGVVLGVTYPLPIIDFSISRQKALQRYQSCSFFDASLHEKGKI